MNAIRSIAFATALFAGCVCLAPQASAAPEGTVSVTFRGTQGRDRVACGNISTEFKVSPGSGTIKWAASAHDIDISFSDVDLRRAPLRDVTITPSSGLLGPGQSTVVKVRGSVAAPRKNFWVWVVAPNKSGSGGVGVEFTCQSR